MIDMLKKLLLPLLVLASLTAASAVASAQGSGKNNTFDGVVRLDKTVHDFGDILVSDGPVTATYKVTNVSQKAILIYNVVTSCGCTEAEWTKSPIKPGESGTIKATFKNDEAGYPFDKSLTVYFSDVKRPVVLRLRGVSHDKQQPLDELYPVHFGNLGFKVVDIKGGNLSQGQQRSGEMKVANFGGSPLKVEFKDVSEGLSIKVTPSTVPARSTATLTYTVTADRNHWGKNYYYATPVVGGKVYKAVVSSKAAAAKPDAGTEAVIAAPNPELGSGRSRIGIYSNIKENFSGWTDEQKKKSSSPVAASSTVSFGKVKAGAKVSGSFTLENKGKSPLKVYKVDSDCLGVTAAAFKDLAAGAKGQLAVSLDTTGLPEGECLVVLTLTTNSPDRPIMSLYLTGWVTK